MFAVAAALSVAATPSFAGPKPKPAPPPNPAPPPKPAQAGAPFFTKLNHGPGNLRGYADLHVHLMNHLGFGGHLLHGAPDVDVLLPAGTLYNGVNANAFKGKTCNEGPQRARTIQEALGSCYSTHRGHDMIKNKCGNHMRQMVISKFAKFHDAHHDEHPQGFPAFTSWPTWDDMNHQQIWVDWIRRAKEGGLRVMVALAGNSVTLAKGIDGNQPYDDKSAGDLQVAEIRRFVGRHKDFMEIAYSAADLRRIVGQDKLAVIVGIELDDIGSFVLAGQHGLPGMPKGFKATASHVNAEVDRLYKLGVRYLFPVHVTDNLFGGAALYQHEFWRANKYHTGQFFDVGCATPADEITVKLESGFDFIKNPALGDLGVQPLPKCAPGSGHTNKRGLTELGRVFLRAVMGRGMIIDVDHGGQKTVNDIIAFTKTTPAGAYPLISGHNTLRANAARDHDSIALKDEARGQKERYFTRAQYAALAERPTIAGVGWSALDASTWAQNVRAVAALGLPVALGSDINGFLRQPRPPTGKCDGKPCVNYASFPQAKTGTRAWDYNREGVAHIGLYPDFLKDVEARGGGDVVQKMFGGAEAFAKMWERAEQVGRGRR
jgi:microsomal dipeptidase-like Zn-dependent dipeptidase